jgi:hypothetical protein
MNLCNAVSKKLGCNKYADEQCRYEVKDNFFSVRKDALCDASHILFKTYSEKDVEEIAREKFVDMIVRSLYEMVFLSYFNEPTENDYFSGHTLPTPEGQELPTTINLLKTHPTEE